MLAWRQHPHRAVAFAVGSRITAHLRHEHKYDETGVEPARRFRFRTEPDIPTGAVAANLSELEAELARCDEGVLRHHCPGHDFSRWVADVFHLLLHAGLSRRTYEAIRLPVPVHLGLPPRRSLSGPPGDQPGGRARALPVLAHGVPYMPWFFDRAGSANGSR